MDVEPWLIERYLMEECGISLLLYGLYFYLVMNDSDCQYH